MSKIKMLCMGISKTVGDTEYVKFRNNLRKKVHIPVGQLRMPGITLFKKLSNMKACGTKIITKRVKRKTSKIFF